MGILLPITPAPMDVPCYTWNTDRDMVVCGADIGGIEYRRVADNDPLRGQCVQMEETYYCGSDDLTRLSAVFKHRMQFFFHNSKITTNNPNASLVTSSIPPDTPFEDTCVSQESHATRFQEVTLGPVTSYATVSW